MPPHSYRCTLGLLFPHNYHAAQTGGFSITSVVGITAGAGAVVLVVFAIVVVVVIVIMKKSNKHQGKN